MSGASRRRAVRSAALAFAGGLLFAVGLALAGMTRPAKVLAFLDVAGAWDPSLAFVMVGAIGVYAVASRLVRRRGASVAGDAFEAQAERPIDARLVAGAAIFGVGWGLAGYCPGPVVASAASLLAPPLVFVVSMAVGMRIEDAVSARRDRVATRRPPADASGGDAPGLPSAP